MTEKSLVPLRKKIDDVDRQILALLKKRVSVLETIAAEKKSKGIPIRDIEREREILAKVARRSREMGISEEDAQAVFREIIAASRRIQEEKVINVAFLGPRGTFTDMAARGFFPSSGTNFIACTSIRDVFREVETGEASYGVVPVESSTEGAVNVTLDQLMSSNLMVYGEIKLRINQNLILPPGLDLSGVKVVLSHPQALAQCRNYLEEHLPGVELKEVSSTARAVSSLSEVQGAAAIGTELAAEIFGMRVVARGIQDNPMSYTRFFILSKSDHPRTGHDKTSLIFAVRHVPGALYKALKVFAERRINLTKIESRPTKREPWEYAFFLDFEGHRTDKICKEVIEDFRKVTTFVKVLGSYPAHREEGLNLKRG